MSTYQKEYKTFFESPAGQQFLTFIHNQLDTEHRKAEDEADPQVSNAHSKTAKAYRDIDEHITSVTLDRKPAK